MPTGRAKDQDVRGTAERRHVTVLFADMVGFTAFAERAGEEAAYNLMQPLYRLMAEAVDAEGGSVKEFTGDGVMAVFGVPVALEDAPLRSCRAALLIHRRLAEMAGRLEASLGIRPALRIGISTGPVVVGQMGSRSGAEATALGDAVNLAARLQALAAPGEVLLSDETQRLVQGLVESRFLGEQVIKGKAGPQRVFLLEDIRHGATRFDAALSRGLTPFVGRARELDALESAVAASRAALRVVDLVGEAGMGKSRLVHELSQRLGAEYHVLAGSCSPDPQPFRPFIDILGEWAGLLRQDDEQTVSRKLNAALDALGLGTPANLALLQNLLGLHHDDESLSGLDGVLVGLCTRDLLRDMLHARCRSARIVVCLEDVHWIDSGTEEVLRTLVADADAPPCFFLCTRRPDYRPPWLGEPRVVSIPVAPLTLKETAGIVQARIGGGHDTFAQKVAQRCEGNPLFAEEIASFLVERRGGRKPRALDADPDATALPSSVQALLAARVDRLAPDSKALLQAASAIGRRFDLGLLTAVAASDVDVPTRLAEMEALNVVHPGDNADDWTFKHSLVRDALYQSLLGDARAALHLRIAQAIEQRSGTRLTEVADTLALHYASTTASEKAFRYLAMAGRKALEIYSLDEAERYYRKALQVVEADPGAASDAALGEMLAGFAQLLDLTAHVGSVNELMARHLPRIAAGARPKDLAVVLHHYSWAMFMRARFPESLDLARRCIDAAQRVGDDGSMAYAQSAFIHVSTVIAPLTLDEFERLARDTVERADRTEDIYLRGWVRFSVGFDYAMRGLSDEVTRQADEIASLASRNPRAASQTHWLRGWVALIEERYAEAAVHGDACTRFGVTPLDRALGRGHKAVALVLGGSPTEGEALARELHEELLARDWQFNARATAFVLGIASIMTGKLRRGIELCERVIREQEALGYNAAADLVRITLAEIYLEVLGGKRRPPLHVLLRNAPSLFRVRFRAAAKAARLLEAAAANPQFHESGAVRARVELDLGRLRLLERRPDIARAHLRHAEEVAVTLGLQAMRERINRALAECT